jgi:hypothetical protein
MLLTARRVVPMLVATAALLAGCGGSGGSGGNGIAAKPATQIVAAAGQAAIHAHSVYVTGSVASSGQQVGLNLHLVNGTGAQGTITTGGLRVDIVSLGTTVYVKGSDAFWQHVGGANAVHLFHGKWLKGPSNGDLGSFAQFSDFTSLFQKLLTHAGPVAKGHTTTIRGQSAITVHDTSQGGTLYVATQGQPYPLEVAKPGANGGRVDFLQYNQSFPISAPKGAIDVTKLGG